MTEKECAGEKITEGDGKNRPPDPGGARSFRNVLQNVEPPQILPFTHVNIQPIFACNGGIDITEHTFAELMHPWRYTITGKANSPQHIPRVIADIKSLNLKGGYCVTRAGRDPRYVLIRCELEDDFRLTLARKVVKLGEKLVRLQRYDPLIEIAKDSPFVPVWVSLPGFPSFLYNPTVLRTVAEILGGSLIAIANRTLHVTRTDAAAFCMEFDLRKEQVHKFPLRLLGRDLGAQRVKYEGIPSYCTECKILGHENKNCRKLSGLQEKRPSAVISAAIGDTTDKFQPTRRKDKQPIQVEPERRVAVDRLPKIRNEPNVPVALPMAAQKQKKWIENKKKN